ncbi:MAG: transcription termination factor Rho [Clostridia bacterium]|nr:transcription termination factor Rho [Clostridia bacterium]
MDYRSLHMKTVADLRRIAKEEKIKVPAGTNKAVLVEMIVEKLKEKAENAPVVQPAKDPEPVREEAAAPAERPAYQRPLSTQQRMGARTQPVQGTYRAQQVRPASRFNPENAQPRVQPNFRRPAPESLPVQEEVSFEEKVNAGVPELIANGDCGDGAGILEIHPEGYGFLRAENYLPGNKDVYVSAAQIRRFNLRTGDYVVGKTRPNQMGDRSVGLIFINEINGQTPDMARRRRFFDTLVPVYPNERLRMEPQNGKDNSLRLIDVIAPVGKGQRGMIVSPPKAGKTTLLKKIANAIAQNNPDVHLIVLLIDERPEEVTEMQRCIQGEVVYSTFDEVPENHTRVSEMVLERAQRLVELGKDVVILLDSITRLARAYNLVIPPTGRSLSGGLDPGALFRPKRFFGAARNIENGGSLTIIATALVDTGSRMDDIIFEEFKGTGNMELHLDRSLSDRRIFPAIDLYKSGTRREELLLTREELEGSYQVRRMLSRGNAQEAAEQLISLMDKTQTNLEFFQKIKGWMNACEKDGFSTR